MFRKSSLIVVALLALLVFAACSTASPQPVQEAETEPAATEAPAEEASVTDEPAEETSEESTGDSTSADGEAATYTVDTEASMFEWYGEKPIGTSESGTVQIDEGALRL